MTQKTQQRFLGKTAVITGAGSGIGEATATLFAQEGAKVIACDISQGRLDALSRTLEAYDIKTCAGDVCNGKVIEEIVKMAQERIDVLANIAGIMDRFLSVGEIDDSTWDKVIAVNLTAVMKLTRAALPIMLEAGHGSIVNVSSEAGLRGSVAGAAYTASKWAINGLTKNTAFFYGDKGIRVNAVAPGAVKTSIEAPMESNLSINRIEPLMKALMPPTAEAIEIAQAIAWLSSDEAKNINGVILPSDGGWGAV